MVDDALYGKEDSRGNWVPKKPVSYGPVFSWPPEGRALFKFFFGFPGYFLPWNVLYAVAAILIWTFLTPSLETMKTFSVGWVALHARQRHRELATTGVYARVRHPQYAGFILVMLGFLLQWPTLLTLAMFPVLVVMYVRLARHEEQAALAQFGDAYRDYRARVPAFIPRWPLR